MVFLNGDMLPIENAKVSVLDRGFLLGDGVYEVIPAYGGKLFRLQQHLDRLQNSLDAVSIPNPYNTKDWQALLQKLIDEKGTGDQSVYLQVTRGVAAKRDHTFSNDITPTVFAMSNPITTLPEDIIENGAAAITLDDIRWKRCDIKAITLLANVMLKQEAHDAGAAEAILIKDGSALEGAASNLFIVKDSVIITQPKSPQLLPGVTRDLVLELAAKNNLAFEERDIKEQELQSADEVWLTSSTKEILPVTKLNDSPVNNGEPGPVWKKISDLYHQYKVELRG